MMPHGRSGSTHGHRTGLLPSQVAEASGRVPVMTAARVIVRRGPATRTDVARCAHDGADNSLRPARSHRLRRPPHRRYTADRQ
jgi:hypothetical protein